MKHAFKNDKTKHGWVLVESTPKPKKFTMDLELVSFLKDGESYITGEEFLKRAKDMKAEMNQYDAEYLLEHQDKIPKEWQRSGSSRAVTCVSRTFAGAAGSGSWTGAGSPTASTPMVVCLVHAS